MSDTTNIEWTDRTWNPVRGCSRVSEGCRNCYAERQAARFSGTGQYMEGFVRRLGARGHVNEASRRAGWTGRVELIPSKLEEPLHWKKPQLVFVNSMSDLFHEALPDDAIREVFRVMQSAPWITFQVLTKRAPRMRDRMSALVARWVVPPPNVWLGVSVEDQATADERIPILLDTPAAVRFVSAEPLIGPVDLRLKRELLTDVMDLDPKRSERHRGTYPFALEPEHRTRRHHALDWVIVGGESGPGARPCEVGWVRDRNDAGFEGEAPHEWPENTQTNESASYQGAPLRVFLCHSKGGDPSEWPEDLRVRGFPRAAAAHVGGGG